MHKLIEYVFEDDISLRVKDEYKISNKFDVHDYMHGRCHLFALIASEILKAPIQAYVSPHPEFGFCLAHVFCKINKNTIFDASGLWNIYSVKSRYDEPGIYLHTDGFRLRQELWEMMKSKEVPSFLKNETQEIIDYLEDMKNIGCLEMIIKENEPMVSIQEILNPKVIKRQKY